MAFGLCVPSRPAPLPPWVKFGNSRGENRGLSGRALSATDELAAAVFRQSRPGPSAELIKCPRPIRAAHLIERELAICCHEGHVWLAIKERPLFRLGGPDPEDVMDPVNSSEDLEREAEILVEQANDVVDALGVDVSQVKVSDTGSLVFRRVALAYERLWRAEALLRCSENRWRWEQTGKPGRTGQEIMERLRPLREKLDPYRRQSPIAHTNTE